MKCLRSSTAGAAALIVRGPLHWSEWTARCVPYMVHRYQDREQDTVVEAQKNTTRVLKHGRLPGLFPFRSTLQEAVSALRAIDGEETDSYQSPWAIGQVGLASGSVLTLYQAQLQQTRDLQQRHREELR